MVAFMFYSFPWSWILSIRLIDVPLATRAAAEQGEGGASAPGSAAEGGAAHSDAPCQWGDNGRAEALFIGYSLTRRPVIAATQARGGPAAVAEH